MLATPSPAAPCSDSSSSSPSSSYRVGVLGATGAVGQRFIQLLEGHPNFHVVALGASARSAGKAYENAVTWQLSVDPPAYVRGMVLTLCTPEAMPGVDIVLSALDADVAGDIEAAFRDAGAAVFSNARNWRMAPDVPLVVPPVNSDHLELVRAQASFAASGGFIVCNANCSTTGLVIALKPLQDAFGIESATVATLQAISGAGYPGLPSMDILDNVVPFIGGEEEKLESEYTKILGTLEGAPAPCGIAPAAFPLSAMVHRVHVRDGHSLALSLRLRAPATPEQVAAALRSWRPADAQPDLARAPSVPAEFLSVRDEPARPQPRLDRDTGRGFTTTVGRIRADPVATVKIFVVSHNTVMGAAGAALLNAELAVLRGLVSRRR